MAPKILIIDDSRSVQVSLQDHCRALGYETVLADSGEEGLRRLRENNVDLIITDILMPGMSGQDVIRHVKQTPSLASIPVLVVSGHSDQELIVTCIELGAEDVLTKPFIPALLHARLQASLRRSELRKMEMQMREVRAAEKCSRELVGALCHNFNQPLTTAMGNIQMLVRLVNCLDQQDACFVHEQTVLNNVPDFGAQPLEVHTAGGQNISRKEIFQGIRETSEAASTSLNRVADLVRNIRALVRPVPKEYLNSGAITDLAASSKHTVLVAGNSEASYGYASCIDIRKT